MVRYPLIIRGADGRERRALENLCCIDTENTTMINGMAGIAESLLTSTKYMNIDDCAIKYKEIAYQLNSSDLKFGDISLFNGVTGTGYFLLHAGNPITFNSVFFPVIDQKRNNNANPDHEQSSPDYISGIFHSCFPLTTLTCNVSDPLLFSKLNLDGYDKSGMILADFFALRLLSLIEIVPGMLKELLSDIFNLETAKIRMQCSIKSNSWQFMKRIQEFEKKRVLLNMDEDELAGQSLLFNNETRIMKTRWDWSKLDKPGVDKVRIITEFLSTPPGKFRLILFRDRTIITEKLTEMGSLTKTIFRNPRRVSDALEDFAGAFEIKSETERLQVRKSALEHIAYFIRRSLLSSNN